MVIWRIYGPPEATRPGLNERAVKGRSAAQKTGGTGRKGDYRATLRAPEPDQGRRTERKGCEEYLKIGDAWVHLRECLSCGYVGCCDSSVSLPQRNGLAFRTLLFSTGADGGLTSRRARHLGNTLRRR